MPGAAGGARLLAAAAAAAAAALPTATALDNGMGLLPEMGINTWYMLHSHLVNYTWQPGYCASCEALDIMAWLRERGFVDLGYTWLNFDDCIVVGRDNATGELIPDPAAFPDGPAAVAAKLRALDARLAMGWYTVRGDTTCASGPPPRLERPGSAGHEALDAATYARWGVRYLKDDTCGGPNMPYTTMRDALNASGVPVFFSLCEPGQGPATAPTGRQVGNGW